MNKHGIPLYRLPTTSQLDLPMRTAQIDPTDSLNWDQVPDQHTFYAFFWFTGGTGTHHIDFKAYEIRPNSLFLMRPGQTHYLTVETALQGYSFFFNEAWLHFDNVSCQAVKLFYLVEHNPVLYLSAAQASAMSYIFAQLGQEFADTQLGRTEALQCLFQLLLIQTQRLYEQTALLGRTATETQLSDSFYHMVGREFRQTHRLDDYAQRLGVSPGHLNRKVKVATGMTAGRFIRQRILIEAKRLLVHTELSATEIATEIGFVDSAYFGRYFKRETGSTPLHFRRAWYEKYQD